MKFTRSLVPCLLTVAIVSYCGGLSQSGTRWSPYLEIHFESVDPTEMRSEFGLLGCLLNIDSTGNCLAECSVWFIYIQHRAALGWNFGDGRAVGSDGLRVVCNRLYGSSDLSRSQEAERIFLCETVNWCWQWIQSKHHVRVPKRGSYYLVNNSVRSRNHAISVTLNLGAVRIIWPACKPVHILYIKRLHSRVRSQSALIWKKTRRSITSSTNRARFL